MAPRIPHEAGLLFALRRIRDGRLIVQGSDLYTDKGRPLPVVLIPFVEELFANGHARVEDPGTASTEQRALVTDAGTELLAELEASTAIVPRGSSTVDKPERPSR